MNEETNQSQPVAQTVNTTPSTTVVTAEQMPFVMSNAVSVKNNAQAISNIGSQAETKEKNQ